ncbi:2OG-Fe(II) oxygenase [Altererythrobacter sp. GH1-8]|uniref:2OG-Fe(II) oxygenase n=1 Tax=Altererythrobacter sp. GH1-8 TaxID=3349333 RepID=UPI00374DC44A
MEFALSPHLDIESCARHFAETGSVSLDGFLPNDQARQLAAHLSERSDWSEVFRGESQTFDMPVTAFDALDDARKQQIDRMIHARAAHTFQFRYRSIRVPDERAQRKPDADALHGFAEFMCDDPTLAVLRQVTGLSRIAFADAQATAYSAGHFLTQHDDSVEGKNRLAAYVFSLSEGWKADWGGLLSFPHGDTVHAFVPRFNALRIFAVPQPHSVTFVPPFVTDTRYSITGWLRSQ